MSDESLQLAPSLTQSKKDTNTATGAEHSHSSSSNASSKSAIAMAMVNSEPASVHGSDDDDEHTLNQLLQAHSAHLENGNHIFDEETTANVRNLDLDLEPLPEAQALPEAEDSHHAGVNVIVTVLEAVLPEVDHVPDPDLLNLNAEANENERDTVLVPEATDPQTQEAVCEKQSSSLTIKELFRMQPNHRTQTPEPEYLTFPIFKKTTRQLGTRGFDGEFKPNDTGAGGSGSGSRGGSGISMFNSRTRMPPAQRTLEDYIKKQTAEYLDTMQREQAQGQELGSPVPAEGTEFPLMVQGLDANWPSPRQRPDLDVIYSIDKAALTVNLHQSSEDEEEDEDEVVEKSFAWEREHLNEEVEHQRIVARKSRAEVIADFVYPHDEVAPEKTTGRLPRPAEVSKAAVLTMSKGAVAAAENFTQQKDILLSALIDKIKVVNQLLMESLIANREMLDILTFPLSHDFEALGRMKGIFWTLSQTARIIKCLDKKTDTNTIIGYAKKEIEGFGAVVTQFMVDLLLLVRDIRVGLKRVKKLANLLEKELKKIFMLPSCVHTSTLPIYTTEMDPTSITFYEHFQGNTFFDYNKTSIELLWTPTLSYFKGFKERDWYCLQVETPQVQVKILLALVKLVKKIFLDVKYKLEEEVDALDTHFSPSSVDIHKILKELKLTMRTVKPSARTGLPENLSQLEELHQQLQIIYDLFNTLDEFQLQFEAGFKWMRSVVGDMSQMAALRPEDMDEFREKQNEKTPLYCSIFARCKQKMDPFLQSHFRFMLLRVPLPNDFILNLLHGAKSKTPWNGHAQNILKIMSAAQIAQFREKQVQEDKADANARVSTVVPVPKKNSGRNTPEAIVPAPVPAPTAGGGAGSQSDTNAVSYPKIPLTVYNVGHVFMEYASSS